MRKYDFPRYVAHAYGEEDDERSCVGNSTVDNQLRLSFLKDLPSICSGLVHVFKLSSFPFEAEAVLKSDEKYLLTGLDQYSRVSIHGLSCGMRQFF